MIKMLIGFVLPLWDKNSKQQLGQPNTGATLDERMVQFETAVHDQDARLTPLEQVMAADAVNTTPLMDFAQKIAENQSQTDSLKRKTTRS